MTRQRFIELITAEQEPLRRFLLALCCGDGMLADDIAQEAILKAYLAKDSYVEHYKFSTWLYRIAYNTMVDYRRKSSTLLTDIDRANVMDSNLRADGEFEYQELYMALESLSVKERTAILLYYLQGYTIREVAQITGDGEDAVKMQLSRGRTHLKNKLSNGR